MKKLSVILMGLFIAIGMWQCTKDSAGPVAPNANVKFLISGQTSAGVNLMKSFATQVADSIVINQALVVIKRVQFLTNTDSAIVDSVVTDIEEDARDDDPSINFRGPFVVDLASGGAVDLGAQFIPPGTYDGIKFKIHKVKSEDLGSTVIPDSLLDWSIIITGSVLDTNGTWAPFVFRTQKDQEFKVRGTFEITSETSLVPYALTFDLGSWFKDEQGQLLDPNDPQNVSEIENAIEKSIEVRTHGGFDHDGDGEDDDHDDDDGVDGDGNGDGDHDGNDD